MSNGFTKSARSIVTKSGSSFSYSSSGFNQGSFTKKDAAKDFVWLKNPYTVSGTTYELAGLDFINGKVMLYFTTLTATILPKSITLLVVEHGRVVHMVLLEQHIHS